MLAELQKLTFESFPYSIAALNRTLIDLYTWMLWIRSMRKEITRVHPSASTG